MKQLIWIVLTFAVLLSAEEVKELVVTSSGIKPTIAFLPFKNESDLKIPTEYLPQNIVASDLELSSRFKTIHSQEIDTAYWYVENVVAYVTGIYSQNSEGKLVIECRLNEMGTDALMYGNLYTLDQKKIRKTMHHFSDYVIKSFYKKLGVASTKLAYVHKSKGKKEIHVSDYDGYNKKRVIADGSIVTMPEWDVNNTALYYVSFKNYHGRVYKRNIYTGITQAVIPNVEQSFVPRESADGKFLLFTKAHRGNSDVYKMDLTSGKKTQLTKHWAIETSADWSPDGAQVVFSSDRGGMPQLYLMNSEGAKFERLTYEGKFNDSPRWSPNGKQIVFCGRKDSGRFNIFVMSMESKEIRQLTFDEGNNESPVWSPDGRLIAFSSTRTGKAQIFIMAADGTGLKQLTTQGSNTSPSWSHYTIQ
ncbi:MAG: hypothetical protein OCD01_11920 [Fibrobacterales bacterium]